MKQLLILLATGWFLVIPAVVHAGNAHPILYLEIYPFADDPTDPGPAPSYVCVHSSSGTGELQCFSPKAPYSFGIVAIHVDGLDTPIAQGWPPPTATGPGGGYLGLTFGVSKTGVACIFGGFWACPGFVQGIGGAPNTIVVSANTKCHDWPDHPGYLKYINMGTNTGASYFGIVNSADEGWIRVINCQAQYDVNTGVGGGAQWGGSKTVACYSHPTEVEPTTWGKIKALYR